MSPAIMEVISMTYIELYNPRGLWGETTKVIGISQKPRSTNNEGKENKRTMDARR